jgi:hypothetical protein
LTQAGRLRKIAANEAMTAIVAVFMGRYLLLEV